MNSNFFFEKKTFKTDKIFPKVKFKKSFTVKNVQPLNRADQNDISFFESIKYKSDAIKKAEDNVKAIKAGVPFKRQYDAIEETFRGKPTGNKVLGLACSFCPYKLPCWGSKLQLLPQQQSKGKNPKWVWYTEVNNPKQEEASA